VDPQIEAIVDLRLRTAPSEGREVARAREFLRTVYSKLFEAARVVECFHHQGRVVGLVMITPPQVDRFGMPEESVLTLCDPQVPGTRTWAESVLRSLGPQLAPHCAAQIDGADRVLLGVLRELNFGTAKLDLIGDVQVALGRLRGHTTRPEDHGLEFAEPGVEQAGEINLLVRDFFLAHPQFGWGGPPADEQQQAALDARELERLKGSLSHEIRTDFTVTRGGKTLGYFGFHYHPEHPLLGSCAGVNIILLPEVQGLGLGKAAYLHMLEAMMELNVATLYGRTSNPAVIHIGRAIGRRLRRIILRRDGPYLADELIYES